MPTNDYFWTYLMQPADVLISIQILQILSYHPYLLVVLITIWFLISSNFLDMNEMDQ